MKKQKWISLLLALALAANLLPLGVFAGEGPEVAGNDGQPVIVNEQPDGQEQNGLEQPAGESAPEASIGDVTYETLEKAVEALNDMEGDSPVTLTLGEGVFSPASNNELLITRNNVTIQGAGKDKTTIACGNMYVSGQAGIMIQADNVTLRDMTVTSTTTETNVSAVKFTGKSGENGFTLLKGGAVENVSFSSENGHALNVHGVDGMQVNGLTVTKAGKCGVSIASSPNMTMRNTAIGGVTWASIGMMYEAGSEVYAVPSSLRLGTGNTLEQSVDPNAPKSAIYSERPLGAQGGTDVLTAEEGAGLVILITPAEDGNNYWTAWNSTDGITATVANSTTGLGFTSLADALAAAKTGETVKLLGNVSVAETVTVNEDKTITLDLGGHTLSGIRLNLYKGHLTVKKGTIQASQPLNVYGAKTPEGNSSVLVIENNVIIDASYGVCVFPEASSGNKYGYNASVHIYGKVTGSNGGVFVSGNIGGNETVNDEMRKHPNNIPVVNIYSGAVVSGDKSGQGIALNGLANVVVAEGASVLGCEAVGVKSGSLRVLGGKLTSVGEAQDPAQANTSGTEDTGAAISITGTYSKYGEINVEVLGGEIVSTNGAALYLGHSLNEGKTLPFEHLVTLSVSGGEFKGTTKAVYLAEPVEEDVTYNVRCITGGTFSNDPSDYVAEGYVVSGSDTAGYTVSKYVAPTPTPDQGGSEPAATPAPTATPIPEATATPQPLATARPVATPTPQPTVAPAPVGETVVTTTAEAVVEDATAVVTVETTQFARAVETAVSEAADAGTAPAVEVQVTAVEGAEAIQVALPADTVITLAAEEGATLAVTSDLAQVHFDAQALNAIAEQADAQGELVLKVAPVAAPALTEAQSAAVGQFPVVELTLQSGDKVISDFSAGSATVTLPYALAEGQRAEGVVVWYVDDNGATTPCDTSYDETAGLVTFTTPHFSKYAIAYDESLLPAQPQVQQPAVTEPAAEEEGGLPVLPLTIGGVVIVLAALAFLLLQLFRSGKKDERGY